MQSSEAAVAHSEPEAAPAEAVTTDQPAEPEASPSTTAEDAEEPAPSGTFHIYRQQPVSKT